MLMSTSSASGSTVRRYRLLGESPWGNPRLFRRIGYCPEQDAFWGFQTAREFVETLGRLSGLSRDEARPAAERALARMGASEFQDRRISTYSKGMRQRTKLAQALDAVVAQQDWNAGSKGSSGTGRSCESSRFLQLKVGRADKPSNTARPILNCQPSCFAQAVAGQRKTGPGRTPDRSCSFGLSPLVLRRRTR